MTTVRTPVPVFNAEKLELIKANEWLELMLKSADVGFVWWNMQTGELLWDENGRRLMGFAKEAESRSVESWLNCVHEEDRPKILAHMDECTYQGKDFNLEYRVVYATGEVRHFLGLGHINRNSENRPEATHGLVIDITERKKPEEQLKDQLHFINQVAVTIPDMLTVMELSSHAIIYANSKPFLLNGFNDVEMSAMSRAERAEFIHPDDLLAIKNYFLNFYTYADDKIQSLEYRARNDAGKWQWYRARGKVFKRDEKGRPTHCVNIVQNINDLKVAEEELLSLKLKQQKEVLNAIIHAQEQERERIGEALHNGVAQLLYGIQTRLQMLEVPVPSEKIYKDIMTIVSEAISDTKRISFELVPAVLKDYGVEVALRALFGKIMMDQPCISMRISGLQTRLPETLEFAIYRIVQELVNNVVKHAHASEANVLVGYRRKMLVIEVNDNGSGFDKKKIKTLHAGIGLQNVKNRVKLMDGKIRIRTGPQQGTKVYISLPLVNG